MLSVPVTFNVNGKLVKGDITLHWNASPEQYEEFVEIMRMTEVNKRSWSFFKSQIGIDDNGNYIYGKTLRGILI